MAERRIRVDESLERELRNIQNRAKQSIEKRFKIENVNIHNNVASKIAAARLAGRRDKISFKLRKTGSNRGILDII